MSSELSWQWNNAITYLLAPVFLSNGNYFSKIVHRNFFLKPLPRCSWSLSETCNSVIYIFWDEVFMVRYTERTGQSWCLAIICWKQSAFERKFHLVIVLSIFLKKYCKKSWSNSSSLIARKKHLIIMYAILLAVS